MAILMKRDDLPAYDSTRDGRDRIDLIKNGIPVESDKISADRIIYHPDDTCAKHYHVGVYHVFVVLYGEATVCTPDGCQTFSKGQTAIIAPDEIHWFENHSGENYAFVEFWSPPPAETVWIIEDDV